MGKRLSWEDRWWHGAGLVVSNSGEVATLRAELGRQNVANFCMLVFVEIGSNNCAESLEVLFSPVFGLWWHISVQMVLHSSFLGKYYFFNLKSFGEDHQWNNLGCGGAAEDMNSKMRE